MSPEERKKAMKWNEEFIEKYEKLFLLMAEDD